MKSSKIDELELKKAQLDNRIKLEKNKAKEADRKLDTRKKIILGAIVLKLIDEHESFKNFFISKGLDEHAKERDRKILGY